MFQVDRQVYGALWGFCAVLLAAGWAAYGLLGGGTVFLTVCFFSPTRGKR